MVVLFLKNVLEIFSQSSYRGQLGLQRLTGTPVNRDSRSNRNMTIHGNTMTIRFSKILERFFNTLFNKNSKKKQLFH